MINLPETIENIILCITALIVFNMLDKYMNRNVKDKDNKILLIPKIIINATLILFLFFCMLGIIVDLLIIYL